MFHNVAMLEHFSKSALKTCGLTAAVVLGLLSSPADNAFAQTRSTAAHTESTTVTAIQYNAADGSLTLTANAAGQFSADLKPFHLTSPERLVVDLPDVAISPWAKTLAVHQNGIDRVELTQSSGLIYHEARLIIFLSDARAAETYKLTVKGNQLVWNNTAPVVAATTAPAKPAAVRAQPINATASQTPMEAALAALHALASTGTGAPAAPTTVGNAASASAFQFANGPLAPGTAVIQNITLTPEGLTLTGNANKTLSVKHQFVLHRPTRLVLDINKSVLADQSLLKTLFSPQGLIKSVRVGQYDANTVRLVIETMLPHRLAITYPDTLANHMAISAVAPSIISQPKGAPAASSSAPPLPVIQQQATAAAGPQVTPNDIALRETQPFTPRVIPLTILPPVVHNLPQGTFTVVVDAGHGGKDMGANREGIMEKVLNMQVAMRLQQALQMRGVTVVMTHTGDTFVPLPGICAITNHCRPYAFVSIHTNASVNPANVGLETYYFTPQSRALATSVHHRLVAAVNTSPDHGIRTARFYVVHHTNIPAILVEMGYISNPRERAELQTDARQQATASAVADGIVEFLGRSLSAQLPTLKPIP